MPAPRAKAELARMLDVMHHESFYVLRTWADEGLGVYLGWTARIGSFSDADAHVNETGDVVLVFSGEEYPGPHTVQDLQARGHRIGEAAASYIVHAYEDDSSFPAGLDGRFHGVVVDRRRRTVQLFNDR